MKSLRERVADKLDTPGFAYNKVRLEVADSIIAMVKRDMKKNGELLTKRDIALSKAIKDAKKILKK